jgi:hypothetical protein
VVAQLNDCFAWLSIIYSVKNAQSLFDFEMMAVGLTTTLLSKAAKINPSAGCALGKGVKSISEAQDRAKRQTSC